MSYNIISYIIYSIITIYITIVVGYQCYKNGYVYVQSIFIDEDTSVSINKILLLGYYLTNIGYTITVIRDWGKVTSLYQLINELSLRIASILFILALMHYMKEASGKDLQQRTTTPLCCHHSQWRLPPWTAQRCWQP